MIYVDQIILSKFCLKCGKDMLELHRDKQGKWLSCVCGERYYPVNVPQTIQVTGYQKREYGLANCIACGSEFMKRSPNGAHCPPCHIYRREHRAEREKLAAQKRREGA